MIITHPARGGQGHLVLDPGAGAVGGEEEEGIGLLGGELRHLEEEAGQGHLQVGRGPVNLPRQESASVATVRIISRLRVQDSVPIVLRDVPSVRNLDFSSFILSHFVLEKTIMFLM